MIAVFKELSALLLALPALAGWSAGQTYCECWQGLGPCGNDMPTALPSGCVNSTGLKSFLGPNGSTSFAADDLVLHASNLPVGQSALLFMGAGETRTPFGDGVLCVTHGGVGIFRYPAAVVGDGGTLEHGPGLVAHSMSHFPRAGWLAPGDTWYFQVWYRDPAGPCGSGFNLSNGLGLTITP